MLIEPSISQKRRTWILPLVAGGLVLAGTAVGVALTQNSSKNGDDLSITTVGEKAFGDLAFNTTILAEDARSATTTLSADTGDGSSSSGSTDAMLAPMMSFSFTYTGEAFDLSETKREVFRRPVLTGPRLGSFLNGTMNPFSGNAFEGATVQSLTLSKGADNYRAFIDYDSGYLSISLEDSSNSLSTQAPELDDGTTIAIANDFINSFGLSRTGFGEPEIQQFSAYLPVATVSSEESSLRADKPEYYSDAVVLYPMMINGVTVYDPSGQKVGLTVSINRVSRKVTYLTQRIGTALESSRYEAITDFETIRQKVSEGGLQKFFAATGENQTTVELEAPEFAYVQTQRYSGGMTGEEIYAPALLFPVPTTSPGSAYVKYVVVPLIAGLSDDAIRTMDTGSIEPMPAVDAAPAL